MAEVRETKLPGVGVKHEFTTHEGRQVGVLVHRDGRRDILVYDVDDADSCSTTIALTSADTRTMSELLGGSTVTAAVDAVQQIEGLAIEWIELPATSSAVHTTIGAGEFRTKTGASVVAVIRGTDTIAAPGPEFSFDPNDVVVAIGTVEGLAVLRDVLRH